MNKQKLCLMVLKNKAIQKLKKGTKRGTWSKGKQKMRSQSRYKEESRTIGK